MPHQAIGPSRLVYDTHLPDENGWGAWVVSERNTHNVAGARAVRCLVFMSASSVRRVWTYPARWFELGDAALLALGEADYSGFTLALA